jgi:hypothetical protein
MKFPRGFTRRTGPTGRVSVHGRESSKKETENGRNKQTNKETREDEGNEGMAGVSSPERTDARSINKNVFFFFFLFLMGDAMMHGLL